MAYPKKASYLYPKGRNQAAMKSKPLIVILAALALSGCEEKHKAIRNELLLIQRTTNDTTQADYIRESAVIFEKFSERRIIFLKAIGFWHR